jgi:Uma2 family endonuclease
MGMPALPATGWTVDMLETLPDDGKRYEIVDGELFVTPSPNVAHQRVVGAMYVHLRAYVEGVRVGEVLLSPADVRSGGRTSVQPDVFVVKGSVRLGARDWPEVNDLLLAVEVVSPGSARADRGAKRGLYQRTRVGEYWIVDIDSRLVERWRPDDERPEIVRRRLEWRPDEASEPLVIDLDALFAEAEGTGG